MRKRLLDSNRAYMSGLKIFRRESLDSQPFFHFQLCCVIELLDLAGPSLGVH